MNSYVYRSLIMNGCGVTADIVRTYCNDSEDIPPVYVETKYSRKPSQ